MNVFVSDYEEEEKRKKTKLRFFQEQSEEKRIYSFLNYRRFAIASSNYNNSWKEAKIYCVSFMKTCIPDCTVNFLASLKKAELSLSFDIKKQEWNRRK